MKKMLDSFFDSFERTTALEWMLCMLLMLTSALVSLAARDDERNPNLSAIFGAQAIYYFLRSILPVCASLRAKSAAELPNETLSSAAEF